MKIVILGNGKLSKAFQEAFMGFEVIVLAKPNWEYPQSGLEAIKSHSPDLIINTIGSGSVAEGQKYFDYQLLAHVGLPNAIMQHFPLTKQIHFSSDYAQMGHDGVKSQYALTKLFLENLMYYHRLFRKNDNIKIIKVTSLYGGEGDDIFKKLLKVAKTGAIEASGNVIRPTDVEALANEISEQIRIDFKGILPISSWYSSEETSVFDIAQYIARTLKNLDQVKVTCPGLDNERPAVCEDPVVNIGGDWKGYVKTLIKSEKHPQ